jgi:hypothetical protein
MNDYNTQISRKLIKTLMYNRFSQIIVKMFHNSYKALGIRSFRVEVKSHIIVVTVMCN